MAIGYDSSGIVLSNPAEGTAHGEVALLGNQLGGITSAAEAGYSAIVTVLRGGDNSISSRGAFSNISRAIWASELNKGMPVFVLVPARHGGTALMIEFVGLPERDVIAVVDEVRFRR